MAVLDRIPLQRSVAVVREDSVVVRPARAQLVGPLVQALLAGGAVALIVLLLDRMPLLLTTFLLLVALILGPSAVLGLVYNVAGSTFSIERRKQTAVLQQGFLGLGLGTAEVVPFGRIDHIAVTGDYDEELSSGVLQDLVQWDVDLVKDNGKRVHIGIVIAARPLAGEGLERANRLARAVAEVATAPAHTGELPAEEPARDEALAEGAAGSPPPRLRRRVRRRREPPPAPEA
jgi:hypothetical protein